MIKTNVSLIDQSIDNQNFVSDHLQFCFYHLPFKYDQRLITWPLIDFINDYFEESFNCCFVVELYLEQILK